MGKLTGSSHGDAANELFVFYRDKALELEDSRQYFMAAVALAMAVEAAVLAYLLVEFGPENGGELRIPDSINLAQLVATANEYGVLDAPIDTPSHVREDGSHPAHLAREVVEKIRQFRKLIHPARSLERGFDPRCFSEADFGTYWKMYESVMHSLVYYI